MYEQTRSIDECAWSLIGGVSGINERQREAGRWKDEGKANCMDRRNVRRDKSQGKERNLEECKKRTAQY